MKEKAFLLACLPNSLLAWRLCLIIDLETWWPQNAATFCKSPTVILGEIFATLTIHLTVKGTKYTCVLNFQAGSFQLQMFYKCNYYPNNGNGHFQAYAIVSSQCPIYEFVFCLMWFHLLHVDEWQMELVRGVNSGRFEPQRQFFVHCQSLLIILRTMICNDTHHCVVMVTDLT